jgi:integrase
LARKRLTATALKNLKTPPPHPSGKKNGRSFVMDSEVRGLGIKVSETGTKSWVVLTRFPGSDNPTARKLAPFNALDLAEAREQARKWLSDIARGVDPADEKRERELAAARRRENSVASVIEDFVREKLSGERQGKHVERDVRQEFVTAWGKRPVADITTDDVLHVVRAIKQRSPSHARLVLGYARRFFDWAIEQHAYDIKVNPCLQLKPTRILGEKRSRERVLSDDELFAFCRASERLPYPFGPAYRLLLLSGLRLNEAVDAKWSEFDLRNGTWTVPASRMKGREGRAADHVVPITPEIAAILESLPRFKSGDYLFSTNFGKSPIYLSYRIKTRVDAKMQRTLRALARKRGEDASKVVLQPWRNHDLRRTLRTTLSKLRVDMDTREAVLGHARQGIVATYDRYDLAPEKKDALQRWAAYVQNLAMPAVEANNVIKLHA